MAVDQVGRADISRHPQVDGQGRQGGPLPVGTQGGPRLVAPGNDGGLARTTEAVDGYIGQLGHSRERYSMWTPAPPVISVGTRG